MNAAIILPTYNERENIGVMLQSYMKRSDKSRGTVFHFLSLMIHRRTVPVLWCVSFKNVYGYYIANRQKEGLGKALLRGFTYAIDKLKADILIQMDADLSHDPSVLPKFLDAIDRGADFVVGSRYIPGGSIPDNWGLHRKIYSVAGNAIVRFGLGYSSVHD